MLKKQLPYCLLFALVFLNILCKKETATPVVKVPYKVDVKVEDFADGLEVSWSEAKSKNFSAYFIWLPANGDSLIPNNPSTSSNNKQYVAAVNGNSNDTLLKITNLWFWTLPFGVNKKGYHRLQALFSDSTPIISRNFKLNEGDIVIEDDILSTKNIGNEIFALNREGTKLYVFDTKTKKISTPITTSNGFVNSSNPIYSILELNVSQTKKEAFVIHNKFVEIIDLNNKAIVKKIDYNNPTDENVTTGFSDNNGKLYISTTKNNIIILDRNNNDKMIKIKGLQTNSFFRYYKIPNENSLLAVESTVPYTLATVKLSADGMSLGVIEKQITFQNPNSDLTFPSILLDNNTFLVGERGFLYDRKLNPLGQIQSKISPVYQMSYATKIGTDFLTIDFENNAFSKYDKSANLIQEKQTYDSSFPISANLINNQLWTIRNVYFEHKTYFALLKI